ncbi:GNAT family N-acetyltransferase [Catenulispora subtropica]|uniref:N-acetyltransferase domain-containing protein n=1 Tax=Catenulispora subtropica TaxID=450798 RepID=A0ABN2T0N5_9ACTN
MLLRDVEPADYDAYVALRCDPAMMAELGGPQPLEAIGPKVAKDAADAAAGTSWIKMIVLDETYPEDVAGAVTIWRDHHGGEEFSEIGWMVLTAYQGRGVGKRAVAMLLDAARADGRWGPVHAFPGVTDAASNGICRSLGFDLLGPEEIEFAGRPFAANHWVYEAGV